jgi:sterol desaturase/sphingolipid hydroxylase (fatty acid hydroxylase superfamily)
MIDEATLGTRDAKGHWVPDRRNDFGPLFAWPTRPLAIARWFVRSYLLSWQLVYFGVAAAVWFVATPNVETMATLRPGWVVAVLARNLAIIVAWYGTWHLVLYVRRAQGTRTKYNAKFPGDSERFTFGNQTKDNVFWSLASGLPIVTAFEVVGLWLFAGGRIPWLRWTTDPVWIVLIMLLIPIWREFHFYAIHRLIHIPALYRRVHSLHHRNTNPGPWSGLSMHPLEHLAYFSAMAVHWVVPSHPLHMLFNQWHLVMAPVPGHSGFERVEVGSAVLDTHGYSHYLHHKLFEVNYSDGAVPLDRWFGSFHDGSPEAAERMRARRSRPVATGAG